MTEWKTIDSAPKDGDQIICWTPEGVDVCWYEETDGDGPQTKGSDSGWFGFLHGTYPGRSFGNPKFFYEASNQPTHWQPLPQPPEETS